MKKAYSLIIITILIVSSLNAQDKKVAVFDPAGEVSISTKNIVREEISSAIVSSAGYAVLERQLINKVLEENKFQMGGMVDDSQISEMGKMMGANYVLVSSIEKMENGNLYISCKLIEVLTSRVEKQKTAQTQKRSDDLVSVVKNMVTEMFGGKVIKQQPETVVTKENKSQQQTAQSKKEPVPTEIKGYYIPNAIGIEAGGGIKFADLGLRYTMNFLPYFGMDIKLCGGYGNVENGNIFIQLLAGIRVATPHFGRQKFTNFYTTLNFGTSYNIIETKYYAPFSFDAEWDLGIHFKHLYFGPVLKIQNLKIVFDKNSEAYKKMYPKPMHDLFVSFGIRIGVDLGTIKKIKNNK